MARNSFKALRVSGLGAHEGHARFTRPTGAHHLPGSSLLLIVALKRQTGRLASAAVPASCSQEERASERGWEGRRGGGRGGHASVHVSKREAASEAASIVKLQSSKVLGSRLLDHGLPPTSKNLEDSLRDSLRAAFAELGAWQPQAAKLVHDLHIIATVTLDYFCVKGAHGRGCIRNKPSSPKEQTYPNVSKL